MRRSHLFGVVAIAAIALAYAIPMQSVGCAQSAHYAAIRSIAEGHPFIDRYANETCDLVKANGHYYAAKGPALDVWTAPYYLLLRAAHAVPKNPNARLAYPNAMAGVPLRAVWQIGLWAVVLPALGLLLLVRKTVDRLEPGSASPSPGFSGLQRSCSRSRRSSSRTLRPLRSLSSLCAPLRSRPERAARRSGRRGRGSRRRHRSPACDSRRRARALCRRRLASAHAARRVRSRRPHRPVAALDLQPVGAREPAAPRLRGRARAGGGRRLAADRVLRPGAAELPRARRALAEPARPARRHARRRGCSRRHPAPLAARSSPRGRSRRDARRGRAHLELCAAPDGLCAWRLVARAAVPDPTLPFLCFALAPALRRRPATVGALALVSAATMVVATSAEPLLQNDDTRHWLSRIGHGNFTATVVSIGGVGHGWLAIIPFYALVLVAAAAAVAATRLPLERRDLAMAAASVVAWLLVEHGAPELLRVDRGVHQSYGLVAAVLLAAACAWAAIRLLPAGLPLLAFATIRTADHTKWALLLVVLVLLALAVSERVRRAPVPA